MNKNHLEKAVLSWSLADYLRSGDEPPSCVIGGITEGQAMDDDEVGIWLKEEIHSLSILREEYPDKFEEQYEAYVLDLEYLCELGKISKDEVKKCKDKGNFKFGQE